LVLFLIEANLSGMAWLRANIGLAGGILLSSWIYILMISLIALALSAWVKWRIAAGAMVLGVMFFLAGFGQAINAVLRSNIGYYINPGALITRVCASLFGLEPPIDISAGSAWIGLLAMCGVCLALLAKKVRAYEVVR
jgi:ABC-2 type transport system permease protein